MSSKETTLKAFAGLGAALAYGFLAAFLTLIGWQFFHWFRDGEWIHVGTSDGLHIALVHCCVKEGSVGRLTAFLEWVDAPVSWLGLHKIAEVLPASLTLFALSAAGNFLFLFCRDRLDVRPGAREVAGAEALPAAPIGRE
jgi:hypothetical protein